MLTGFFKQIEEKVRNMLDNCWTSYVKIHIVKTRDSIQMPGFSGSSTRRETGKKEPEAGENPLTVT